jgi:hypothetical protein
LFQIIRITPPLEPAGDGCSIGRARLHLALRDILRRDATLPEE